MFGNDSIVDKLRSFDVYRKLPKDYLKPTFIGACLSVVAMTMMVLLFMNELSAFVKVKTSSEMLVDTNIGSEKLKINIDIVMKRLPCHIVSIDSQDVMGTHSLNVQAKISKKRLDRNGKVITELIGEKSIQSAHNPNVNYEEVKNAVKDEEGCQLVGNLEVLKVPGNFHVSSHAFGSVIARLAGEGLYKFDISHTINHVSFGDESDIKHIRNNFNVGILNPIDGVSKSQNSENKIYEYYLKVVPTSYTDITGTTYNAHQFTANNNENHAHMTVPTVFFRYDISPILVKYVQHKQTFFHFFIQICAIVGGMFTVMGILDNLLHRFTRSASKDQ